MMDKIDDDNMLQPDTPLSYQKMKGRAFLSLEMILE
jgi:hypothetical protein